MKPSKLILVSLLLLPCLALQAGETPVTRLAPITWPTAVHPVTNAVRNSVVMIRLPGALGSGVYLGDGYFATAWHVIQDNPDATIYAGNYQTKRVAEDRVWDVAILRSQTTVTDLKAVQIADRDPRIGDIVYGAGYGASMHDHDGLKTVQLRVWGGRVFEKNGSTRAAGYNWYSFYQGAIPGDSGGPVFYEDGSYVGPLWGRGEGTTIACCNSIFRRLWQRISPAQRGGCPPPGGCPPRGYGCPPPGGGDQAPQVPDEYPPAPDDGGDMGLNPPLNMDDLVDRLAGDDRFKGPKGDKGDKGENGDSVEVDLDKLVPMLIEHLAKDPRFKGPPGEPGQVDQAELESLVDAKLAQIPKHIDVEIYKKDGSLFDKERVELGGTLRLQIRDE